MVEDDLQAREELSRKISEGTSRGMVAYWSQAGVKRDRRAAAKRRRAIRFREGQIRGALSQGLTSENNDRIARYQRELDELRAEHDQASAR